MKFGAFPTLRRGGRLCPPAAPKARYGCGTPLAGAVRPTSPQSISTTSPVFLIRICIAFFQFGICFAQTKLLGKSKKGQPSLLGRFKGIPKKGLPRESSEAIRVGIGGTTKRTRPAACGGARDVKFVPTQIPLCHSFFRPSTALSFSYEKESGVETFPARYACGFLRPPGVNPAPPARQTLCLRHR